MSGNYVDEGLHNWDFIKNTVFSLLKTVIAVTSTVHTELRWKSHPGKTMNSKTADLQKLAEILLCPGASALHQPTSRISWSRSGTRQDSAKTLYNGAASMFR